jgi:probable O-glycosylation ligase (exosortase A-associated)
MKQLIVMILLTLTGSCGAIIEPMLGVAVYYILAIVRPQYLWDWALPPGIAWSFYVAVATIVMAVACTASGRRPMTRGPWPTRGHVLILGFGCWIGVTYLLAHDREAAWPWVVEYSKIFVMFWASMILIRNVRHIWILYLLAALSVGYIAYEINVLYFVNGFLRIQRDGYGGFDNNVAALMLAMGVPLCYFAWEGSRSRFRWLFLALIPVLLHAVLMTYSRGAMIALLASAPLIGLRSHYRGRFAVVGLAVALMLPVLAGPEIRARFFSIQQHEQDASANERRNSWAAGWAIACGNPVFGVGVRNANLYSYEYGAAFQGQTIHSQYLQIAADNGFVGLGLYLACLAAVGIELHRVRRETLRRKGPDSARILALGAGIECALLVFCVGSIFLSLEVFELLYLLLLLGAQLGPLTRCSAAATRPVLTRVPVALPTVA